MWGSMSEDNLRKILDSGLVEYEEKWLNDVKPNTGGALEVIERELAINKRDPKRTRHKL